VRERLSHLAPQSISSPKGSCAKTAAWHDLLLVEVKKPDESFWNKPFFKEQGKPGARLFKLSPA
jgi:hypothetical protein